MQYRVDDYADDTRTEPNPLTTPVRNRRHGGRGNRSNQRHRAIRQSVRGW